jgi:hypothetical protein
MCACEPSFVCVACRDTPTDDSYPENEREPVEVEPLVRELETHRG